MKYIAPILLLFILTIAAFATEVGSPRISIAPLLGKDASAYLSNLNVPFSVSTRKDPPLVTWTGKVPNLGHMTLNAPGIADPNKPAPVKGITIYFADSSPATWQLAFAQIGLSPESGKEEKTDAGESKIIFTAPDGTNWNAFFNRALTAEEAKRSGRTPFPILNISEARKGK